MHFQCKCGSKNRIASIFNKDRRDLIVTKKELIYDDLPIIKSELEEGFYCATCLDKITNHISKLIKMLW
jgi:hypothetical protein